MRIIVTPIERSFFLKILSDKKLKQYGMGMPVMRTCITKDKILQWSYEKKEDTHQKMLISNSALSLKLQKLPSFLQNMPTLEHCQLITNGPIFLLFSVLIVTCIMRNL